MTINHMKIMLFHNLTSSMNVRVINITLKGSVVLILEMHLTTLVAVNSVLFLCVLHLSKEIILLQLNGHDDAKLFTKYQHG
jgi:hypothetical protein